MIRVKLKIAHAEQRVTRPSFYFADREAAGLFAHWAGKLANVKVLHTNECTVDTVTSAMAKLSHAKPLLTPVQTAD